MNPDTNTNLPSPVDEARPPQSAQTPVPAVRTAAIPAPTTDASTQALARLQASATGSIAAVQPTQDEDNLVLDKEWILKAKKIVQTTAHDPYEQNRQLAQVKADYLQKRYGKVIKLAE